MVVLLSVGGLISGCRRAPTPLVVTPVSARQIMDADRRLNDQANASLDLAIQDRHETGAAAQIDDAIFREMHAAGDNAFAYPERETNLQAFVPRQHGYPAEFLGEWTSSASDGSLGTSMGLFVRPTAADPWRVTLYIYAAHDSPDPLPDIAVDKDGYALPLPPAAMKAVSATTDSLPRDVAAYWNRYPDPAFPVPPTLAAGSWTTTHNDDKRTDVAAKAAKQISEVSTTSPGRYQYRSAYRTRAGAALIFFTLTERVTLSVRPPMSLTGPLTYNGLQVLPSPENSGSLTSSLDLLYTMAAVVPLSGRPARVIDGYWGPVSAARVG
jgi:hypothetical protein